METRMKPSALDRYLALPHRPGCTYHIYSGDRHCSCGRDAAIRELEQLKKQPAQQPELIKVKEIIE